MSQFDRIIQRRPAVDPEELERVRVRAMARLATIMEPEAADAPPEATAAGPASAPPIVVEHAPASATSLGTRPPEHDRPLVPVMAVVASPEAEVEEGPIASSGAAVEPDVGADEATDGKLAAIGATSSTDAPAAPTTIWASSTDGATEAGPVAVAVTDAVVEPIRDPDDAPIVMAAADPPAPPPVLASGYCPYCATRLDPAPTEDRDCLRCEQRIIVRAVGDGQLVFLTEAAIEVFETQRIREENERRWTEERRVWLELAASVGVPASRIDKLERAGPSAEAVESARDLYLSTSDQAAQEAESRGVWDIAAGLRRSQANDLHRMAGHPAPPDAQPIELYRRAALTELRGIGAIARSAALVGSRCCDACRTDDGTVVRISTEARRSRLPHAGCPEGLCACHWDLSPADVQAVVRYLQRTGRPINGT